MMTLDFTVQMSVVFWGMLAVLIASATALFAQAVSAAFSERRSEQQTNVIPLERRTKAATNSLRSAA